MMTMYKTARLAAATVIAAAWWTTPRHTLGAQEALRSGEARVGCFRGRPLPH